MKRSLSVLTILSTAACGNGLVDPNYHGQVLTTLRGTLTASGPMASADPVSLAILWVPPSLINSGWPARGSADTIACGDERSSVTTAENVAWVSESVTYQAQFPISFQIPVTSLPPASVRLDLAQAGGQGSWSMGILVAYVDTNGNGQFDLSRPGAPGDELVASTLSQADYTAIFYLDGTIPPTSNMEVPQGFSVINGGVEHPTEIHLPSQAIELVVGQNAAGEDGNLVSCAAIERREHIGGPVPAVLADRRCSEFTRELMWTAPNVVPERCVVEQRRGRACLDPAVEAPADWLCH